MCSVTGYMQLNGYVPSESFLNAFKLLLKKSEIRGRDGFGYATKIGLSWEPTMYKCVPPNTPNYDQINKHTVGSVFISNHRAEPTTEYIKNKLITDQQPYFYENTVSVHNGTISNDKVFFKNEHMVPQTEVDSFAIPVAISKYGPDAILSKLIGSMSILTMTNNEFIAYRNYNPLYAFRVKGENVIVFSSLPDAFELFKEFQTETI
jgi:7-cyano-7-deazaguanine synthase